MSMWESLQTSGFWVTTEVLFSTWWQNDSIILHLGCWNVHNRIFFQWIPLQFDIYGNETANGLSKKGRLGSSVSRLSFYLRTCFMSQTWNQLLLEKDLVDDWYDCNHPGAAFIRLLWPSYTAVIFVLFGICWASLPPYPLKFTPLCKVQFETCHPCPHLDMHCMPEESAIKWNKKQHSFITRMKMSGSKFHFGVKNIVN